MHVVVPELRVADVIFNTSILLDALQQAAAKGSRPQLVLFPELCLTGSTCGDLFFQPLLQRKALESLARLQEAAQQLNLWAVVGLPLALAGKLYDAAALLSPQGLAGISLAAQPRDFSGRQPNRWFAPASDLSIGMIDLLGKRVDRRRSHIQLPELISVTYRFALATCEMGNMTARSAYC